MHLLSAVVLAAASLAALSILWFAVCTGIAPVASSRRAYFMQADLSGATVLTCYLFRQGMRDLQRKLARDRQPLTVIVSNTFTMPASRPCAVVTLEDFYRTRILVYRWDPRGCTGDEGLTRPRPPAPLAAPDRARSTRTGP